MEEREVDFTELIGEHMLSGVEFGTAPKGEYDDSDPNTVDFIMDGETYSAIEDPSDGYRSSMRSLRQNRAGVEIKNRFAPVKVIGSMRPDDDYEKNNVLDFVDATNGKIVLSIGTADIDDYYPGFVGDWTPENLSINEGAKS